MTCIVGLVHDNRVYIGGDSAGIDDDHMYDIRATPKVFKRGEFVYGCTNSFRMADILRHSFKEPPIKGDILKYMATTYVDKLFKCFDKAHYKLTEEGEDANNGPVYLVGVRGRLFCIFGDWQVTELKRKFDAIGCGGPFALGALHVLEQTDKTPEEKVTEALKASSQFSTIYEPFHILSL